MIISIANPIYDAVFKYLMEDARVAKTILSALLQKEVVEVDVRKHEYTNGSRDKMVYLLGHRVGDIKEPVLYVSHKSYDYNGNEVTEGMPDPFVESLTHDSIIVQIPLLHGRVNNRLTKVLSVFDQKKKNKDNHQVLNINEDEYMGDQEMEHILHRLLSAASDSNLRQEMNVEDEYFSAIENRDTAIMMRDQRIAEQNAQLEQNKAQLEQNKAQLEQQQSALLASAKTMKAAGISPEQISAMTMLPIEEVEKL